MQYIIFFALVCTFELCPYFAPGPQELINRSMLIRELKELPIFPANDLSDEKILSISSVPNHKYTQTEAYLRIYFDIPETDTLNRNDIEKYVRKILERFTDLLDDKKIDMNDVVRLCMGMIDNEFRYANDYVFYHAFKKEIGMLFDVQREVFDILNMTNKDFPLIRDLYQISSMGPLFPYKNANELLEKRPKIEDYNIPWNIYLLSANLALFANRRDSGADSLLFFLSSVSISRVDFLNKFFEEWQFDKKYKTRIEDLYNSLHDSQGHILQIFIPESQVNIYTYLSQSEGTPYHLDKITTTYNEKLRYHPNMLDVLKKYRNNPYQISEFKTDAKSPDWYIIDRLQARLLLIPEFFNPINGIRILQFNLTSDTKAQEYRKKLRVLVQEMMIDWMQKAEIKQLFKKYPSTLKKLNEYVEGGILYNSIQEFSSDIELVNNIYGTL